MQQQQQVLVSVSSFMKLQNLTRMRRKALACRSAQAAGLQSRIPEMLATQGCLHVSLRPHIKLPGLFGNFVSAARPFLRGFQLFAKPDICICSCRSVPIQIAQLVTAMFRWISERVGNPAMLQHLEICSIDIRSFLQRVGELHASL